jgi:hypothetical protein
MKQTPRHRVERSETPWWWFGQPWARAQAEQEMNDEDPAGHVLPSGLTAQEEEEEREDAEWMRAMAP